jgi:hypothetical protein
LTEEFICSKWLNVKEDTEYRKIINGTNVTAQKALESIYSKLDANWITQPEHPLEVTGE